MLVQKDKFENGKIFKNIVNKVSIYEDLENIKENINDLVNKGLDLNSKDEQGYTLLGRLLIRKNKNNFDRIIEFKTFKEMNFNIVEFLINLKADVNSLNGSLDETPLMLAIKKYKCNTIDVDVEIIETLINNGANLNFKNKVNKTPLDLLSNVISNYHKNECYDPIQIARLIEIFEFMKREGARFNKE